MDYRLTDSHADPPGKTEALHGEKLLRLPVCNWCFCEPDDAPPVGPLPAEAAGSIRFGTFNNFAKASPAIMDLWAAILVAMPSSRLLIKSRGLGQQSVRARINGYFASRGVRADRLEIRGHEPNVGSHLAAYNQMDIALDTFPYHGTTTTCEAMWMGVPVISLAGQTHVSRVGVSLLNSVGLPELIAQTPKEYVEIAVGLAKDPRRLAELRRALRSRMRASPLVDAPRFARDIEAAYRQMWLIWCERRREFRFTISGDMRIQQQLELGLSHHQAGRLVEAEETYCQILAQEPNNVDALHLRGMLAAQTGHSDAAIEYFRQVTRLRPDNAAAHSNLGNVLASSGQINEAIASYRQAIRVNPENAEAYSNLGSVLKGAGQIDEAIASYQKAIVLKPDLPEAQYNLGNALRSMGRLDEAIAAFRQAIRVKPDYPQAHINLGNSFKDTGQLDKAIACYRQAIQLKPDFAECTAI